MAKRPDSNPLIRQAGSIPKGSLGTASDCVRPDLLESNKRPDTPEHIKKYRQSYKNQPGLRVQHFGLKDDAENLDRNRAYGRSTLGSEKVGEIIKSQNLNGMADKFNDIREAKYASNIKEPLGRPMSRYYKWPQTIEDSS